MHLLFSSILAMTIISSSAQIMPPKYIRSTASDTMSAFHKQNLGQIIFSSEYIDPKNANPVLMRDSFVLPDYIKALLLLEKDLTDYYHEMESSGKYPMETWQVSKKVSMGCRIKVNDVEKALFYTDFLLEFQQADFTTICYPLTNETEMHWQVPDYGSPMPYFSQIIRGLSAGTHKIYMEFFIATPEHDFAGKLLASGSFDLSFDEEGRKEYYMNSGKQRYFNAPGFGKYKVTIANSCSANINYKIVRDGVRIYENGPHALYGVATRFDIGDQITIDDKVVYTCTGIDNEEVDLCKIKP